MAERIIPSVNDNKENYMSTDYLLTGLNNSSERDRLLFVIQELTEIAMLIK